MSSLKDRLRSGTPATSPAPAAPVRVLEPQEPVEEVSTAGVVSSYPGGVQDILDAIEGVEIEAVVGGALQRIRFAGGINPADVAGMLRTLDANAKVRDAFPMKAAFGNRETKLARALVINLRITDSGKFIDITCQNGEDLSVSVSKKNSDTFLDSLRALGKLHEKNVAKAEKAFAEKGAAVLILKDEEQFGVQYWKTDDGKAFMEGMVAEAPAVVEEGGES
jgi:hypothetical protein